MGTITQRRLPAEDRRKSPSEQLKGRDRLDKSEMVGQHVN